MKVFTLFFTLLTFSTFSQKPLNGNLIFRLDGLKKVDQFWRNELTKLQNVEAVYTNLTLDQIIAKSA